MNDAELIRAIQRGDQIMFKVRKMLGVDGFPNKEQMQDKKFMEKLLNTEKASFGMGIMIPSWNQAACFPLSHGKANPASFLQSARHNSLIVGCP